MDRTRPVVISILTINQERLLADCLESLFAHPPRVPFLVHVFDQASTDGTPRVLEEFRRRAPDRLVVHRHPENIGFVRANNLVFRKYPGHDVVLLNDDTVLLPGWLDALAARAASDPRIGIVGARLVYPNGVLQEAGGEVFRDATGRNIGKWDDPARPEYLEARDVDYCSGACLYVRAEVLAETGGFDERFAPAYYEDSDLCFAARTRGWRVVYEPASVVIHREGATNGVDLRQGVKRWQAVNRERFLEKWGAVLARHRRGTWHNPPPPGGRSILFIHEMPPLFDRAAGDRRLFELLRGLARRHAVTLLAVDARGNKARYGDTLRRAGVLVAPNDAPRWPLFGLGGDAPPTSCTLEMLLEQNDFDLAVIEFYRVARVYLPLLRRLAPDLPVAVDSVDVHFLREEREARVAGDPRLFLRAERTRATELAVYGMADAVLAVTDDDREALREAGLDTPVQVVSHPVSVAGDVPPRDGRRGIVFIGNFNHPPNADGVTWFVREAWPLVRERRPDLVFRVGGSFLPDEIRRLEGNGVEVAGFVPDLDAFFDSAVAAVAPLRFGAGIKGKVLESMARGLPTVTTSVGTEGMAPEAGRHLLVADDPAGFAEAVLRVVEDPDLWKTLSREGRSFVAERWGLPAILARAERLAASPLPRRPFPARTSLEIDLSRPTEPCPVVPGVLGLVVAADDPRDAALLVDHVRNLHGEVDALVLTGGTDRETWHEHALLGRFRLAVPPARDLPAVLRAAAPHLAGDRVLFLSPRHAFFRETLDRMKEALDETPGRPGIVHALAIPAAPGPDGREPRERAADRARREPGGRPAEVFLARRDALLEGEAVAAPAPGAVVVDPALPPEIRVREPRDPGRALVVVLGGGEEARAAWRLPGEPGEVVHLPAADPPEGDRLAELVAGSRAGFLLVADGRHRPLGPFLPRVLRLAAGDADAAVLYPVPAADSVPWPGDWFVTTRLAGDLPGLPGMLAMGAPALLFRDPNPEDFAGTPAGPACLWRAWQRRGTARALPLLHDGERFLLARDWPGAEEIRRDTLRAAAGLARTWRLTDLLPVEHLRGSFAPWWTAPARVVELVDEAIELARRPGLARRVTWDRGPIDPLLLWFRIQLEAAPLFREALEAIRPENENLPPGGHRPDPEAAGRRFLAETLAVTARLLAAAGRREEARRRIAEARSLAPRDPVVLAAAAEDALAAGDEADALALARDLRRGLARDTEAGPWPRGGAVVRALVLEAVLLARARRDRELLAMLDHLEEWHLRPGGEAGRKMLELEAGALERLGRTDEARLALLSALALAPGVTDRPPSGGRPAARPTPPAGTGTARVPGPAAGPAVPAG